jgi:hypothetical protein
MSQLCQPCHEQGRVRIAHRIVSDTPMCDACWKDQPLPKSKAKAIVRRAAAVGANGAVPTITLPASGQICDVMWAALPLEKKAALLSKLSEF